MKIVNIVPGFGGTFYCGNCLRDSAYVRSLRNLGHDAVTLPVYLPLSLDGKVGKPDKPVFYGAVNIYLKQAFPIMRKMPAWMEKAFNSDWILKYAASKAGSTRAEGLEDMTTSMLMGMDGNQASELRELVDFLKYHEKPDIVHFSNALLIGMAKSIKEETGIPTVCSLQDEDVWIDAMRPEYQEEMWNLLAEKARDIDAFIAVSSYFAGIMKDKMHIPEEKLHVIPIGIIPENYEVHKPAIDPPAIGYLSRLNEENGFSILVDAFIKLKSDPQFRTLKLIATGGKTGDDKAFIALQVKKLKNAGLLDFVEFPDDFSAIGIRELFKSISLLSVPVLKGEAFGIYQIEAMASGIPIVQPSLGAFPEIVEKTSGGLIYNPNTPNALAQKLAEALTTPGLLEKLSLAGQENVEKYYNSNLLTNKMTDLYSSVL
jgi:glycosyltransferase involved in cell wall biosynthesis